MIRESTAWLKEACIEVSFYVLLGLGGRKHWQRHVVETAKILNEKHTVIKRWRLLRGANIRSELITDRIEQEIRILESHGRPKLDG